MSYTPALHWLFTHWFSAYGIWKILWFFLFYKPHYWICFVSRVLLSLLFSYCCWTGPGAHLASYCLCNPTVDGCLLSRRSHLWEWKWEFPSVYIKLVTLGSQLGLFFCSWGDFFGLCTCSSKLPLLFPLFSTLFSSHRPLRKMIVTREPSLATL